MHREILQNGMTSITNIFVCPSIVMETNIIIIGSLNYLSPFKALQLYYNNPRDSRSSTPKRASTTLSPTYPCYKQVFHCASILIFMRISIWVIFLKRTMDSPLHKNLVINNLKIIAWSWAIFLKFWIIEIMALHGGVDLCFLCEINILKLKNIEWYKNKELLHKMYLAKIGHFNMCVCVWHFYGFQVWNREHLIWNYFFKEEPHKGGRCLLGPSTFPHYKEIHTKLFLNESHKTGKVGKDISFGNITP